MPEIHEIASDVDAEDGSVHVTGPKGVCYSMSPAAALDTSDRLLEAATKAHGQRIAKSERIDRHNG